MNLSVIGEELCKAHDVQTPSSRRKPGPSMRAGMTMRDFAIVSNVKGFCAIAVRGTPSTPAANARPQERFRVICYANAQIR